MFCPYVPGSCLLPQEVPRTVTLFDFCSDYWSNLLKTDLVKFVNEWYGIGESVSTLPALQAAVLHLIGYKVSVTQRQQAEKPLVASAR